MRGRSSRPHLALALAALTIVALEWAPRDWVTEWARWVLEAGVAGVALMIAWRRQTELRLIPILSVSLVFHLLLILVHLHVGSGGDYEPQTIYAPQGEALLAGDYPESEYPTGAVLLFAFEALVGGDDVGVSHAFLMVPFQLAIVLGIWSLRTRWSAWFAAFVGLWPLNEHFWEFRFDLAPTALLLLGLVLALRERWIPSGLLLGVGTAVKWTPALSVLTLALWLLWRGRPGRAAALVGAAVLAFLALTLPFLAWSPDEVVAAYTTQGGRDVTGESVFYPLLRLFGIARVESFYDAPLMVPGWVDGAMIAVQAIAVLGTVMCAVTVPRLREATVLAAATPVVFLLTNRIFSPQFLVLLTVAWAFAGALVSSNRYDQLLIGGLAMVATLANILVYPTSLYHWLYASTVLFIAAFAATAWMLARATGLGVGRPRNPDVRSA